jgi:ABC-2 type transport system permease protein
VSRLLGFLPHDIRALVMKDIRTFFRDPVQWSQALIFFGLLGIYFTNLRSFNYHVKIEYWRNMLGFLNVFSVSAVMCSLSARFAYPQLSLEGQGFWIVGLSPTTMKRVLMTKFCAAAVSMTAIGVILVLLSCGMLNMPWIGRAVALLLISAISLAVSGLSTGLGAVFLDLRQTNPSAIVSGFGGTLNLVIGLGFMLAAILPFSLIFHLQQAMNLAAPQVRAGLLWSALWLAVITALTTAVPLWLGVRSLDRRDY